jgi:bacteriocin-like protein
MNNQNRELSPTQPNSEPDKGAPDFVKTELSEEELSQVSGGKSSSCLALVCANGKHFATGKITL